MIGAHSKMIHGIYHVGCARRAFENGGQSQSHTSLEFPDGSLPNLKISVARTFPQSSLFSRHPIRRNLVKDDVGLRKAMNMIHL